MPSRRKPSTPSWRNRVKELRYVRPGDLADHPHQWRIHPKEQAAALTGILTEIGIAGALLAYESPTTGLTSIDGHLRKSLDASVPWPTLILDVDDAEAALLLASHDPLAAMARADRAQLATLLADVQSGDAAVQTMLAELAQRTGVTPPDDAYEHWQDMPVFDQEDQSAYQTILMHCASAEDVAALSMLLGQPITEKTHYLWYPKQERIKMKDYTVEDAT